MTLSLDTAYRFFGGEVEASSTPTICGLPDSRRHQLWAIAPADCRRSVSPNTIFADAILTSAKWSAVALNAEAYFDCGKVCSGSIASVWPETTATSGLPR